MEGWKLETMFTDSFGQAAQFIKDAMESLDDEEEDGDDDDSEMA